MDQRPKRTHPPPVSEHLECLPFDENWWAPVQRRSASKRCPPQRQKQLTSQSVKPTLRVGPLWTPIYTPAFLESLISLVHCGFEAAIRPDRERGQGFLTHKHRKFRYLTGAACLLGRTRLVRVVVTAWDAGLDLDVVGLDRLCRVGSHGLRRVLEYREHERCAL